jgi:hypothetical protein
MWHVGGRGEVHEGFWWEKQGENYLEDLAVEGRILNVS